MGGRGLRDYAGRVRLLKRRRPRIEKLKRNGDLSGLRAALHYRSPRLDPTGEEFDVGVLLRIEAAEALSHFYGSIVSEGLADALADPHPAVRLAAVRGIANLGVPTSPEVLVEKVVTWTDPPDGEARLRALGTLVDWQLEGVPNLFAAALIETAAFTPEERHRAALAALLQADPRGDGASDSVANDLIRVLEHSPAAEVSVRAESVLGWLGPAAGDAVISALERDVAGPGAVRAAGEISDSRAVDPLVGMLAHRDAETRQSAASALGRLNDTRAVPSLLVATRDTTQEVRNAASAALDRMGIAAVIIGLATVIRASGGATAIEEQAAEATAVLDGATGSPDSERGLPEGMEWAGETVGRLLKRGK